MSYIMKKFICILYLKDKYSSEELKKMGLYKLLDKNPNKNLEEEEDLDPYDQIPAT